MSRNAWTKDKDLPAGQIYGTYTSLGLSTEECERLAKISQKIASSSVLRYRKDACLNAQKSDQDLITMASLLSIQYEPIITSHRRFLGPIIVGVKKIILRFINRWIKLSLTKQVEFNQMSFNLALKLESLEQRIQLLEQQAKDKA